MRRGQAVAAVAAGLLVLLVTLPNLGPTIRAGRAEGTRGTFTAEELRCVQHPGHEQCTWSGTFRVAGDAARTGYDLYGAGRGDLREGEAVAALDVGRAGRVYPPSGSREWMVTSGFTAFGLVLLATGTRSLLIALRKAPPRVGGGRDHDAGSPGVSSGTMGDA